MTDRFSFEAEPEGSEVRIRLKGSFDVHVTLRADLLFDDALFGHPGMGVVVDLLAVTRLDLEAVRTLARWRERAGSEHRSFRVDATPLPDPV